MTVQRPIPISEQNFLQTLLNSGSFKGSSKHLKKEAARTLKEKEDALNPTEVCEQDKGTRDLWVQRSPSLIRLTGTVLGHGWTI
eukprot:6970915-Pyramimonas_sp.AAC.2